MIMDMGQLLRLLPIFLQIEIQCRRWGSCSVIWQVLFLLTVWRYIACRMKGARLTSETSGNTQVVLTCWPLNSRVCTMGASFPYTKATLISTDRCEL